MEWCREHIATSELNEADWYRMRCAVLHNGSAMADSAKGRPSQYAWFSFVDPENAPAEWHRHVQEGDPQKRNITLDIAHLADEMFTGMEKWFKHVGESPDLQTRIARNLPRLVRIQRKTITKEIPPDPGSPKVMRVRMSTYTTSSS